MTALSTRVTQGKMGAAIDTWHQTVLLDPDLLLFHEGAVRLLEVAPTEFEWLESFACGIWAVGVDTTELKLGNRMKALGIMTGFYWRDSSDERAQAKAAIADLEEKWDAAVWTNEKLVWEPAGASWPPVPSGGAAVVNEAVAERVNSQQPTNYGRVVDRDDEDCEELLAEFITIYEIDFTFTP